MTSSLFRRRVMASAVALAALCVVGSEAAHAQAVAVRPADNYQANGADIAGWTWLRADGNFAEWTWSPGQGSPREVCINFEVLVTNGANGGSGQSTNVNAQVIGPDNRPQRVKLELENRFRPRVTADTNGIGYAVSGSICPRNGGQLFSQGFRVRLDWPTSNRNHIAVRRQAASVASTR